ncbi:MAG: ABC transporter permease [Pseudomonadota bacterium]
MFRSALAAALRHLARTRLYTAISVFGLAIGLWAALIAGLVIRSQQDFDSGVAGRDQVYLLATHSNLPGRPVSVGPDSHTRIGRRLHEQFGEIRSVARLQQITARLQQGAIEARQDLYWADPDTFVVLPMPVLAGDPVTAMKLPDSLVMTPSIARKYFASDRPLGRTLLLAGKPMVVRAIIAEPQANETQFAAGLFASALASFSPLSMQDANPKNELGSNFYMTSARTFVRLAPGTDVGALREKIDLFVAGLWQNVEEQRSVELVRLDRINTHPQLNRGITAKLLMVAALGVITLLIAGVNFVNLLLARTGSRAIEVGVRRLAGAGRGSIAAQFLAESLVQVLIAGLVAMALAEWLLPRINAFLETGARFEYWREPRLPIIVILLALVPGLLAGGASAAIVAGLRPLDAFSGRLRHSRAANGVRNLLVTLQFTLLVGLIICCGAFYLQRSFATSEAIGLDTEHMLALVTPCQQGLIDELRALPQVRGVSCTGMEFLDFGSSINGGFRGARGEDHNLNVVPVDAATLALYGVQPLAGQGLSDTVDGKFLINEAAVRELGFSHPADALGKPGGPSIGTKTIKYPAREITGVVRDFSLEPVNERVPPTAYINAPGEFGAVHLRLTGVRLPETLAAIDRAWRDAGGRGLPSGSLSTTASSAAICPCSGRRRASASLRCWPACWPASACWGSRH